MGIVANGKDPVDDKVHGAPEAFGRAPPLDIARLPLPAHYCVVLLNQSVAAFTEKIPIFEKTHLFGVRRG